MPDCGGSGCSIWIHGQCRPVATGLNGMPFGLPRLIKHISCDFLRDQAGALLEEFETYDEPDAWEAVRTGREAAP